MNIKSNFFHILTKIFLKFYGIKIYDNFFQFYILDLLENNISNLPFYRSEYDISGNLKKKSGLVSYINPGSEVYSLIADVLLNKNILTNKNKIDRMYYNLYLPNENPQYHVDSQEDTDITLLLYLDNNIINLNENGCTEFQIGNLVLGIPCVKNRVVYFNSKLTHRATSFLNKDRYSLAIKIV